MSQGLYKSKVLKKALAQEGYLEKASPSFLNSKTKNAGYNNYTKFGRDYGWNGVYWCCQFVWWCFWKAYKDRYTELIIKTASCEVMRQEMIKRGWYGNTPRKGALIFFKVGGKPGANHIGIVYKVSGTTVYTIEGNTSGGSTVVDNGGLVARKAYNRGYGNILGYGYPVYDVKPVHAPAPVLQRGAVGAGVRKLQLCLNEVLEVNLVVDGEYGEKTSEAVKSFKSLYGLSNSNGDIYGKKMYRALKKEIKRINKKVTEKK